jgi:hypothetical protein
MGRSSRSIEIIDPHNTQAVEKRKELPDLAEDVARAGFRRLKALIDRDILEHRDLIETTKMAHDRSRSGLRAQAAVQGFARKIEGEAYGEAIAKGIPALCKLLKVNLSDLPKTEVKVRERKKPEPEDSLPEGGPDQEALIESFLEDQQEALHE